MKVMDDSKKKTDRTIDVLLVDDDPALRGVMARGLKRKGFQVSAAATADDALRLVADSGIPIDVVVMDIVLPDSWGSQVAMEQSLYRPNTPVIFISGHAMEDAVLEASAGQGEIVFLSKPFTVDELSETILRVVGARAEGPDTD